MNRKDLDTLRHVSGLLLESNPLPTKELILELMDMDDEGRLPVCA